MCGKQLHDRCPIAALPLNFTRFSPAATTVRTFATRQTTSSLNDSNPNLSNRPPKKTILLDGCDFEHWLIVVENPVGEPTCDEIIDSYIKTLATIVGRYRSFSMKAESVNSSPSDSAQSTAGSSPEVSPKQPFIIGVAGGTASGKTTVCNMIISQLRDQRVVLINLDSFYHPLTKEQVNKVHEFNFDHPDAFDLDLLLSCTETLKSGRAVNIPNYDYKNHKKIEPSRVVNPSDVIILEGILVLHDHRVRDLMSMKIFVDTDSDLRLARRIQRDTGDRERDIQYVLDQYAKFVKPSFEEFILPSKKYADIIIPRGADNDVAIDLIVQHIFTKLGQHNLCKIYTNLFVIHSTCQIRGMHTIVRDAKTTNPDFVFYADRLIRLVVEHGLGHLPFTEKQITTPTGSIYTGVVFCKRLCGVSVVRSGESMENALRACCKGIKIGKILIHGAGNNGRQLIYEKLPADIASRHVLLLDPVLASGNSAIEAISLLLTKGVPESNIIFLNLISAPQGIHAVCKKFPRLKIVTSEIDSALNKDSRVIPGMGEFGDRYFGTDNDAGISVSHQFCR